MNKKKKLLIPSLPSGFQDRWGKTLSLKKKLLKVIEDNFINYGYSALETSPMELSSNIGNSLAEDDSNPMADIFTFNEEGKEISLRYDLSNPLARFYAQNFLELPSPYKRYQIGADVFRREKPGNGRFKSFGQCDADIIGKFNSAQANAELCNLIASTLIKCGLKPSQFKIAISNRKIVTGLMDQLKIIDEKQKQKVLRAIDKLEKFGIKGVKALLTDKRTDESGAVTIGAKLSEDQASEIINFLEITDLEKLKFNFKNSELIQEGIREIEELLKIISYGGYLDLIKFDIAKVRGLDIYTGFIVETNLTFEVKNPKGKVIDPGSCVSGGEYLVTKFKGDDFLGSGVSFGIDRLVFCLEQLSQIQVDENKPVIVCIMDEKFLPQYYEILKLLRENNINSEIFLDYKKNLGKQLQFANRKSLPLAVICGSDEFKEGTITIKNLLGVKGVNNQVTVPKEKLIDEIKKFL